MTETKPFVPVWEKAALTFEEASAYTGIGINRLRELAKEHPSSTVPAFSKKTCSHFDPGMI